MAVEGRRASKNGGAATDRVEPTAAAAGLGERAASLIVVSNRLPVRMSYKRGQLSMERSSGGLAAALAGVHGIRAWVGWPGSSIPETQRKRATEAMREQGVVPVFLTADQERNYYAGMCNSVLWPLLHYFPSRVDLGVKSWPAYVEVNNLFADTICSIAEQGDSVWVHDFHLMLLPGMLRARRPDLRIGFFLHVPFPSSELWRHLPQREALLRGVLGSDHIGFHTADYLRHFRSSCLRVLGIETEADGISIGARRVSLRAHPIGTDVGRFLRALRDPAAGQEMRQLADRLRDRRMILGVERLDYTKGVLAKFQAFERFLERHPERRKDTFMLQVLVPSREEHEGYRTLLREIEKEVGRINGRYGSPGFVPLEYVHRNLDDPELVALYRSAHAMLVTPVRDGMNLVAQEFVLCQGHDPDSPDHARGMLVLSEFAGAAMMLPHALLVNPWDIDGIVAALENALALPHAERRMRIDAMCERVVELDSRRWAGEFVERLDRAAQRNRELQPAPIDQAAVDSLVQRFQRARRRLLFVDYDGTLREIEPRPELASPTPAILDLLRRLTALERTEVHLVSGRKQGTLASWFDGLPIHIGAEHGYCRRDANGRWQTQSGLDLSWMPRVREILLQVTEEVPGSFLEQKSCGIAWHYRLADPAYGPWRARELVPSLHELLANQPAEPLIGHAVVEVRAKGADKGSYVASVIEAAPETDFVFCAGDDRTDFDMYRRLPEHAVICHVGSIAREAGYIVDSPASFRELLSALT